MKTWLWLLPFLSLSAWAQDWKLDPAHSQVRFVIKQMNVPTEGGFSRLTGHANFDPARPEAGQFQVDVETASIDTGSTEGDEEVQRPAWLDAKRFPYAHFVSKSLTREADGHYTARGDLAIKGIARPVAIPLRLSRQGAGWRAEGRLPLKRSTWGIGGGDWAEVVADDLEVRFNLALLP
jgi:polyisoprenoid-binding protein YceI